MKKVNCAILFAVSIFLLTGCGGNDDSGSFPKTKYWTPEDYRDVNRELNSLKVNQEELPNLTNPKTAAIFYKIVDTTNFTVVANDDQLGIKHRSEFTSNMFYQYKDLFASYSILDRQDKYQYPLELVEIMKFGLSLQVYYIKIGNENIIKNADDPKAADVVDILKKNQEVLIKNYIIYLDFINYEDRFSDAALIRYSEGISNFFPRLITTIVPDGDYGGMLEKVDNMLKKSKNVLIIAQLQNIQSLLKNKIQENHPVHG